MILYITHVLPIIFPYIFDSIFLYQVLSTVIFYKRCIDSSILNKTPELIQYSDKVIYQNVSQMLWHEMHVNTFPDAQKSSKHVGSSIFEQQVSPLQNLRSWWRHQMETFSASLALCAEGIRRSPVNSPHKGQWRGALVFSLICAMNKRLSKQSYLRRHRAHYGVTVLQYLCVDIEAAIRFLHVLTRTLGRLVQEVASGTTLAALFRAGRTMLTTLCRHGQGSSYECAQPLRDDVTM